MSVEKRAIRQRLREQRRTLSPDTVDAVGRAVLAQLREFAPYAAAASVIAYIASENEVPTGGVLDDAVQSGKRLYLPRSGAADGVVHWRPGAPLTTGRVGVYEPAAGAPTHPAVPAVALLPVVGWDARGSRLGRGGGFYDRLFTLLTGGITRVGLAYEFQECLWLPRDAWDISMEYVITERRIVRCGGAVVEASLQKEGLQLS
jgi:5-formyltetrahydrofolate cyclo-ligase